VTALQISLIAAIVLPALAIVLWPLRGGRPAAAASSPGRASDDRRLELEEEKSALYRALRELEFDHDAGHLSDPDFQSLRDRYESRAGTVIAELDALGITVRGGPEPAPALPPPRAPALRTPRASWTRHPATFAAGAAALVIFGVIIGVNAGRFTERDESFTPPGARIPVPGPPPSPGGPPMARLEPGKPIPPEMLAGMLQAARQSLFEGRYSEAIAAYQAVLKRDERNVDAMTHLGLIVAVGGHADSALETFDKALKIDPTYAPAYLYRGQVLYEQKQDYAGAVAAWERFMALVPTGEDRDRVAELVARARSQRPPRP
jgi:tetratricopeptide (TPR) repeat protein